MEGHLMPDHVHVVMSIPPKHAIAQIICLIKGKSAIQIVRKFVGRKKNFTGQHFWARGYHVSTVGRDEDAIRKYIKEQEKKDRRIDQLNFYDEQIACHLLGGAYFNPLRVVHISSHRFYRWCMTIMMLKGSIVNKAFLFFCLG